MAMKRFFYWVVPLAFFLCLTSCKPKRTDAKSLFPPDHFRKEIAKLQKADVAADVNAAFARMNFRFLQVVGKTGVIPGVKWTDEMRVRYGVQILDGTGDRIYGKDHRQFKKVARDYAERYNKLMWAKIEAMEKRKTEPADGW